MLRHDGCRIGALAWYLRIRRKSRQSGWEVGVGGRRLVAELRRWLLGVPGWQIATGIAWERAVLRVSVVHRSVVAIGTAHQ
jgi:hypothetical protein